MSNLVAMYLFLGGAGAGAFFCVQGMSVITWMKRRRDIYECYGFGRMPALRHGRGRSTLEAMYRYRAVCALGRSNAWLATLEKRVIVVSLGMTLLGCLCLVCDLGLPKNIAALFFRLPTTYINFGVWALAILVICEATLLTCGNACSRNAVIIDCVAKALGVASSLYIMVYTGLVLYGAVGIDLWHSAALPLLFFFSSLSAGFATVMLCLDIVDTRILGANPVFRSAAWIDILLIVFEALILVVYVGDVSGIAAGQKAVELLLAGQNAVIFLGGYCFIGLLIPLALDIIAIKGYSGVWFFILTGLATLVGAFCLRLVLAIAGTNVFF